MSSLILFSSVYYLLLCFPFFIFHLARKLKKCWENKNDSDKCFPFFSQEYEIWKKRNNSATEIKFFILCFHFQLLSFSLVLRKKSSNLKGMRGKRKKRNFFFPTRFLSLFCHLIVFFYSLIFYSVALHGSYLTSIKSRWDKLITFEWRTFLKDDLTLYWRKAKFLNKTTQESRKSKAEILKYLICVQHSGRRKLEAHKISIFDGYQSRKLL